MRNYSAVKPMFAHRGYPTNLVTKPSDYDVWWDDMHSVTYFTLDELLQVDYDAIVEDRRYEKQVAPNIIDGGATCEPGAGERMPLKEFIGEWFVDMILELEKVQDALGPILFVIGFDS